MFGDKTMKKDTISLIGLGIFIVFLISSLAYSLVGPAETSEGSCYDRYNSEINGVTCKVSTPTEQTIMISIIMFIIAFLGFFVSMLGWDLYL